MTPYPILGWAGLPAELSRPEVFQAIAEAGLTAFMTCSGTPVTIGRQLDLAAEAGLQALVCDPRFAPGTARDETLAALDAYHAHPAVLGWYVQDEPYRSGFDACAAMVELLRGQTPERVAYVNAYGFGCRGADSYFDYVEGYARIIRPQMLSFDCYPLSRIPPQADWAKFYANDRGLEFPELGAYYRDCYWEAWETCRQVGWKYDLPLWGFALSTPHQHSIWFYGPVTEGSVRLEAFTGLAYGSRALQYFTLPTWLETAWDDGILAPDGTPSLRYELFRRVNRDVAALGPVVAGLSVQGVYHTGELTSGCRRFASVRDGKDLPHRPVQRVTGDAVILSFLRGADDARYLLLVNRNPGRAARVEVELLPGWQAQEVLRPTGHCGPPRGPNFLLGFEPGDGRLLRLCAAVSPPA